MTSNDIEKQLNRHYNKIVEDSFETQERNREILAPFVSREELEKLDARRHDDFVLERKFFEDILSFLREKHSIPDIYFFPHSVQITTGMALGENGYVLYFSKKFQQTLCDICALSSYLFFEDDGGRLSDRDECRLKNILLGYIDTYANCREMPTVDETIYRIYAADSVIHGASMARSMLAFILCHEIAHVIINPSLKNVSSSEEFDADKLGCEMYFDLLSSGRTFGAMRLDPSMNRAPLLLMDLLELIDDYMVSIFGKRLMSDASHPSAGMRKCYLLNFYLFQYEKDSSVLYQIFYEQWLAIKAHLHLNITNIATNIKAMS